MAWIKAYSLRPFAVFEVNLGQSFNVKDRIGSKAITAVDVVYAFKRVDATQYEYDATPRLTGTFPTYTILAGANVSNTSVLNVFVYAK